MTFWEIAIVFCAALAAVGLLVMDHHERMAKIKYTQGHNE